MEPIGTITQYFPFIDSETRNVLKEVMDQSSDYYDFATRLSELVVNTDCPVMVVYFSIHHCMLTLKYRVIVDQIQEKYGDHQILGPHLFFASAYQGKFEDITKVHELADKILDTEPEDWIALEMNFWKFEADMRNYPTTMYETATMDRIQELIGSNPDFKFYEIVLNDYLEIRAHADGDSEERIRCLDKGIELAQQLDDRLRLAHLNVRKANIILNRDRKESRRLLEQAYEINDASMGIPFMFAETIYNLSILDGIRGDFDRAIERCLKTVTIREREGLNTGNASYYLSVYYNMIGDPESGLEWGRMAEEQMRSRPYLINRTILCQIWSLIILDRLAEASVLLDMIREPIMKSGDETHLAWLHFVTGIYESQEGNTSMALSSIDQALRIYESQGSGFLHELVFLYYLAKIEITSDDPEVVSPSLALLEEKAESENLPGILGLALLLKGDLAVRTNDEESLREIIPQIQRLIENENLKYIESRFESLQRKL